MAIASESTWPAAPGDSYDRIYLSPHLDDIALSCGGQIYQARQAGERVLAVTIMTADPAPGSALSPFAHYLHEQWGGSSTPFAERRREDAAACALLDIDYVHWPLADAIYRRDPGTGGVLYDSGAAIFGPMAPVERPLIAALAQRLTKLPVASRVYSPLTAGNHVDHQIVRAAAQAAFGAALHYYEDYPYGQTPWAVDQVLARGAAWSLRRVALEPAAVAARIAAIAAHASQMEILFGGTAVMAERVRAHVAQIGGERTWQLAADG